MHLTERNYKLIREQLPSVKLVQVIHVIDENAVDEAHRIICQGGCVIA